MLATQTYTHMATARWFRRRLPEDDEPQPEDDEPLRQRTARRLPQRQWLVILCVALVLSVVLVMLEGAPLIHRPV